MEQQSPEIKKTRGLLEDMRMQGPSVTTPNNESIKPTKNENLSGTELFSLFTANIIEEKKLFTR